MRKKDRIKQEEFMLAYEPIHDRFERFCQVRSASIIDQKDLMNETLCRAYRDWEKIKKKESLLFYLFGTAKNIVLNTARKRSEMRLNGTEIKNIHVNNQAELELEVAFLYRQIERLTEEKKEALILFEISGFSIKEIAQIQNTSEGSVHMRLSRARKELKVLLTDHKQNPLKTLNISSHER